LQTHTNINITYTHILVFLTISPLPFLLFPSLLLLFTSTHRSAGTVVLQSPSPPHRAAAQKCVYLGDTVAVSEVLAEGQHKLRHENHECDTVGVHCREREREGKRNKKGAVRVEQKKR
jgi:hypothetical protein